MVTTPTSTTSVSCAKCLVAALSPSSLFPRSALGSREPESSPYTRHSCVVIWSTPQPPMQARRRSWRRSEERKAEAMEEEEEEDEEETEKRPRRPRTRPRGFFESRVPTNPPLLLLPLLPTAAAALLLFRKKNAYGSSSKANALSAAATSHAGAMSTTSLDHILGPKIADAKWRATSV